MRVLITGAAGTIGLDLRAGLRGRHELLRLLDVAEQEPAGAGEEVVTASVADAAAMRAAAEGMDAIVHLAANPVDAPFDVILEPNIVGTQRVFEAAVAAGVPRVVYASSHHAAGFWPRSHPMRVTDPVRPGQPLRRLEGLRRGRRPAAPRQARPAGRLPAHPVLDRPAGRHAPPRLVAEPARRRRARAPLPGRAASSASR